MVEKFYEIWILKKIVNEIRRTGFNKTDALDSPDAHNISNSLSFLILFKLTRIVMNNEIGIVNEVIFGINMAI